MIAQLIVNADDFGLTRGHNAAIIGAHRNGIVTSTSILANGNAFEDAVALLQTCSTLGVGVHLTLTEVPALTPEMAHRFAGGRLPVTNQPFVRQMLKNALPRRAIYCEFKAQIRRVVDSGIEPTHLDGHKYIHLLPGITEIVAELAELFGIPVVRVPKQIVDYRSLSRAARLPGLVMVHSLSVRAAHIVKQHGRHTSDRFAGFVDTGHLTAQSIQRLLGAPQPGATEFVCHPAYRTDEHDALFNMGCRWIREYDFETETAAVSNSALRQKLVSAGWSLSHFGQLQQRSYA